MKKRIERGIECDKSPLPSPTCMLTQTPLLYANIPQYTVEYLHTPVFAELERKISVRTPREELIQRGVLKEIPDPPLPVHQEEDAEDSPQTQLAQQQLQQLHLQGRIMGLCLHVVCRQVLGVSVWCACVSQLLSIFFVPSFVANFSFYQVDLYFVCLGCW